MYKHSSAYRKARSCETTLIKLVEGWRKARDNKLAVSILATDMSKAFDSLHPLMARNFGHFRTETSCGLHEEFIYTTGIYGKVRADPTN